MARAWRGLWAIVGLGGAGVARACHVTPAPTEHSILGRPDSRPQRQLTMLPGIRSGGAGQALKVPLESRRGGWGRRRRQACRARRRRTRAGERAARRRDAHGKSTSRPGQARPNGKKTRCIGKIVACATKGMHHTQLGAPVAEGQRSTRRMQRARAAGDFGVSVGRPPPPPPHQTIAQNESNNHEFVRGTLVDPERACALRAREGYGWARGL
eukprot:gene14094-biopygen18610